ncbi:hypothetical protein [Sediminicola arcticus]|jgi:hypothetical protein|uniref:Uncharacterized protein n=1 Tax=Sediminicola arcticus TaxID=1574308 RepID=A0ABV2SXH6_9FLAO
MSQKIKSLLYFVCFIASAAMYHGLEPEMEQNSTAIESIKINKVNTNELDANKVANLDLME